MRVDCGKGRPAVFQTDNAEFDSPYPLQVLHKGSAEILLDILVLLLLTLYNFSC